MNVTNFSYTGSHPLEAVVKSLTTDRDEWKARALAAEAEAAQLRADLGAARAELGTLRKRINIVMNQAAIQCDDGNWNYSDYMRGLANGLLLAKSDLDNSPYLPLARPERWLEEVAGRQWRPNDDQALFEDKDIEGEIILTATFQQRNHCWNVDGISILPSGVVAWRPRTAAPDEEE